MAVFCGSSRCRKWLHGSNGSCRGDRCQSWLLQWLLQWLSQRSMPVVAAPVAVVRCSEAGVPVVCRSRVCRSRLLLFAAPVAVARRGSVCRWKLQYLLLVASVSVAPGSSQARTAVAVVHGSLQWLSCAASVSVAPGAPVSVACRSSISCTGVALSGEVVRSTPVAVVPVARVTVVRSLRFQCLQYLPLIAAPVSVA